MKFRHLAQIFLVFFAAVVLSACQPRNNLPSTSPAPSPTGTPSPVALPPDWQRLEDSVLGVSIGHPEGWNTSLAPGLTGETSITSFNPGSTPDTGGVPADELKVAITRFSPELGVEYTPPDQEDILEQREIMVAGQTAQWQRVRGLGESIQVTFMHDGMRYVIAAYPADSEHLEQFQTMLDTLELIPAVQLEQPDVRTAINSPLMVRGQAPGPWFFEGQFTARLETIDGQVLAEAPLEAQGEWMTENAVPFSGTLSFRPPAGETNVRLILVKANPSGLPENARTVAVPLQLQ